jgi:DNA-directed RNA polymerase specialized sigma24 family protein
MSAQILERNEDSRGDIREDLHAAVRARKVANLRYQEALIKAREEGWNNTQIARACGVSEAAIRLYWTRHPQLQVFTSGVAS